MCYGFLQHKAQPYPTAAATPDEDDGKLNECDICFEDTAPKEFVHLSCRHAFCATCLREWSAKTGIPTCPLCRVELVYKRCKHQLPVFLFQPGSRIAKRELDGWCRNCSHIARWVPGYRKLTHMTASARHLKAAVKLEMHMLHVMARMDWPADAGRQREHLQAERLEWERRERESRAARQEAAEKSRETKERESKERREEKRRELARRREESPAEKNERERKGREAWEATRKRVAAETGDWGYTRRMTPSNGVR